MYVFETPGHGWTDRARVGKQDSRHLASRAQGPVHTVSLTSVYTSHHLVPRTR